MNSRKGINKVVAPFIIINGLSFFLMLAFGKTGEKGLWTFTNLFNLTVILTMLTFAAFSLFHSYKIFREFMNKKRMKLAAGQFIVSLAIFLGLSGFIWVLAEAIWNNWKG